MIKLAHPVVDEEEQRAVMEALTSGQLAQGPRVRAFEEAFAAWIGVRHAVAVNSGTAALHVALLAHGIGAGDEVIVPAFSFSATANAVLQAGASPVFVDVRDDDFGIDVTQVRGRMTERTRAVIAVHLYGQPCDVVALEELCVERGVVLIEDAAQAVGAAAAGRMAGSFGTGCFSFYATKNLQTGEGGMITTDDDGVAERARAVRSQGERRRYVTELLGWNYRMTEVAAALGHAQLARLPQRNEQRRRNAAYLTSRLDGYPVTPPRELPGRGHVYHQYTIVCAGRAERDALQAHMTKSAIETGVFYPLPIHRQPLYIERGYGDVDLPVSQRLADTVLSLPVHPALSADDLRAVADAAREGLGVR